MREMHAEVAGRLAHEALASGPGEVCAVFRRSFYLRFPSERYACVGDLALGRGPLNALVPGITMPQFGERLLVDVGNARRWAPPAHAFDAAAKLDELERAARGRLPAEGLACLLLGEPNSLAKHARPALVALGRWLQGGSLDDDAEMLVGLGPGLTPSGDDYLGGILLALRARGRVPRAEELWRWLKPRLAARTGAISVAHLAAAAQGEANEAMHRALGCLFDNPAEWPQTLSALDMIGHCSGWDGLAGAVAAARIP